MVKKGQIIYTGYSAQLVTAAVKHARELDQEESAKAAADELKRQNRGVDNALRLVTKILPEDPPKPVISHMNSDHTHLIYPGGLTLCWKYANFRGNIGVVHYYCDKCRRETTGLVYNWSSLSRELTNPPASSTIAHFEDCPEYEAPPKSKPLPVLPIPPSLEQRLGDLIREIVQDELAYERRIQN